MKRALAARAKQGGLPNGVGSASPKPETPMPSSQERSSDSSLNGPVPVPSSSSSAPLEALKISASHGKASSAPTSPPFSVSPRPKKRMRESTVKLEEEEDDDSDASAFYLRHQNRALASQLRMLKYQLTRLERERDYRRTQSSKAVQNLNSLQATWTQMESALQCGQPSPPENSDSGADRSDSTTIVPASTGSGSSVELIGALLDSLAALGATTAGKKKTRIREEREDDDSSCSSSDMQEETYPSAELMDEGDSPYLDDLLRITDNVSRRAGALQRWIWSLLQRAESSSTSEGPDANSSTMQNLQKLAHLKAKNKTLKAQLKEMSRSRDQMSDSDKRVRRGLYRLAAGRVKLKEVLKAIVVSDEDKEAAASWMEVTPAVPAVITSVAKTIASAAATKETAGEKPSAENIEQIATLSKQVTDLEQVAKARDDQIKKLLMEREEQLKKINSLVLNGNQNDSKALTEQEVKQTDLYAEITAKLSTSERHTQAAEEKLNKLKQEWAQALADAEAARAAMEEMQAKHLKRWKDIVDENPDIPAENGEPLGDKKGEEIIRLKHKLTQAIENVRQADTTRKTLEEAVTMNQSLQAKLEEIKGKYTALQASRVSSSSHANNHISSSTPPVTGGLSTPKQKHSSSGSSSSQSAEKIDKSDKDMVKLHRDYRKVRKELAAAIASKETAKAKLSINERERESLNQTNYRLLKQAAERDDVNAKSLSTILHLKQLTEQITKEKENLEQQAKSSQQVALAARLAANARERVSEEFEKQRKELESRANNLERKCAEAAKGKELLEGRMSQQKARMSSLLKDADKAKKRCDELASESTTLQEDKQKMMESLAVAKREAIEASKVSESLTKQASATVKGGVPSGFTVDQLNTQVTVLKSRLMCAVCNHRDKKCILLRCRHMFCKNCVDENIKNRSRKCPACGTRFDTKDVADVWL